MCPPASILPSLMEGSSEHSHSLSSLPLDSMPIPLSENRFFSLSLFLLLSRAQHAWAIISHAPLLFLTPLFHSFVLVVRAPTRLAALACTRACFILVECASCAPIRDSTGAHFSRRRTATRVNRTLVAPAALLHRVARALAVSLFPLVLSRLICGNAFRSPRTRLSRVRSVRKRRRNDMLHPRDDDPLSSRSA